MDFCGHLNIQAAERAGKPLLVPSDQENEGSPHPLWKDVLFAPIFEKRFLGRKTGSAVITTTTVSQAIYWASQFCRPCSSIKLFVSGVALYILFWVDLLDWCWWLSCFVFFSRVIDPPAWSPLTSLDWLLVNLGPERELKCVTMIIILLWNLYPCSSTCECRITIFLYKNKHKVPSVYKESAGCSLVGHVFPTIFCMALYTRVLYHIFSYVQNV
jgi:hypothetical protein